jgi:rhamnulokinase
MSYKNYLIFDFGASNGRSVICSYNGSKFDMEVTHRFNNDPVYVTGTLYWDILKLYLELVTGIQYSVKKHRRIESLAIGAWGGRFWFH